MPSSIPPLASYDAPGYGDTDRAAALILRTPSCRCCTGCRRPTARHGSPLSSKVCSRG